MRPAKKNLVEGKDYVLKNNDVHFTEYIPKPDDIISVMCNTKRGYYNVTVGGAITFNGTLYQRIYKEIRERCRNRVREHDLWIKKELKKRNLLVRLLMGD